MFLFNGTQHTEDDGRESNRGFFFQAMLPADGRFVGVPYGAFFLHMTNRYKCIPLGLYRQTQTGKSFQVINLIYYSM